MAQAATDYPVQSSVDYPDQPLNWLTTLFRPIFLLPIAIILSAISGGNIVFATILMILFRRKYPRWWFDWIVELGVDRRGSPFARVRPSGVGKLRIH